MAGREWWSNAFPLFSVRRAWDHKARAHTPSFLRIPHSPTWTLPLYAVNTSAVFPYNNFCFFVQFRVKNNSRNSSNERESKFSSRRRKRRVCKPDITCFGGCQSQTWSIWGIPKERKRRRTSVCRLFRADWPWSPSEVVVVVIQATLAPRVLKVRKRVSLSSSSRLALYYKPGTVQYKTLVLVPAGSEQAERCHHCCCTTKLWCFCDL